MPATGDARALSGITVLDLTRFAPGAFCTVMLADLGADVVRVDSPGTNLMMFGTTTGIARGKRSIALDFRHEGYDAVLRRLVAGADVVVDNARPGSLDERGYGPRQATADHPGLVWCSITGFGQDGPYATWPGHDLTYLAHAGLLSGLHALPWFPQSVVAVPTGALMAVAAITTALFDRERTGKGAHVDVALSESAAWLLSSNEGHLSDAGWTIPESPSRNLYQCSDGRWVTTAADEPRTWSALCTALGLDDLAAARPAPTEHEAVIQRFRDAFAARPAAEWVADLGPAGVTISFAHEGSTYVDDPQVRARGAVVEVDGKPFPANPIRIHGADGPRTSTVTTPPPPIGADTDAVLVEAGFSADEVSAMHDSGLLGAAE
jgi:alpha-methylacyl-CoA racemase